MVPFTIISQRMNYLGVNLKEEVKVLYAENYKTLRKEIEDDTATLQQDAKNTQQHNRKGKSLQ